MGTDTIEETNKASEKQGYETGEEGDATAAERLRFMEEQGMEGPKRGVEEAEASRGQFWQQAYPPTQGVSDCLYLPIRLRIRIKPDRDHESEANFNEQHLVSSSE
jgi:hypothetical protein